MWRPKKEISVAMSGVAFALILVFAGYQLFIFGQVDTSLFGSTSQLGLALTLGSTFGINLGESMKKGEDVPGKFAFLASFFGTLFLVMIGYGSYSIYRNQVTTGLLTVLDLLITAVAFTGIMHTKLVGPKGIIHLKQILDGFSTKGSPAILTGYATATVAGVWYGVAVGGGVAVVINLPWAWREYKKWQNGTETVREVRQY